MTNVATATSTDVQNDFGGYLNAVAAGQMMVHPLGLGRHHAPSRNL